MIELEGLYMHYPVASGAGSGPIRILDDIDLSIAAGESVAVAGPSGCGKTTLLLLLAGLEQPASGAVRLQGRALQELDADGLADLRRDHVGIVFQSFHLVPSLTALDNVALPLQIAGRADARQRAVQLLGRVGLEARQGHYPSQLSGGEKQRVAIARALVHRPALLLADEPTGNLDEHTGAAIADLLFELNEETGTTMVLVTHDMDFAARCDRVLRLHDARLHEQPPPAGGRDEPAARTGAGAAAAGAA